MEGEAVVGVVTETGKAWAAVAEVVTEIEKASAAAAEVVLRAGV